MITWLEQLHTGAQWYHLASKKRTPLQRLAYRTQGIITPGNALTILGALLTLWGLQLFFAHSSAWSIALLISGRLLDVFDGHIARLTKTSSPLGEVFDAVADKLVIIAAAVGFITMGIYPWYYIFTFLLIEELTTALVAMHARQQGIVLHASRLGKYTTFGLWTVIVVGLTAYTFINTLSPLFWVIALMITVLLSVIVVAMRLSALVGYILAIQSEKRRRQKKK